MKEFPQKRNPAQKTRMPMRPAWRTNTLHRNPFVISFTSIEFHRKLLPGRSLQVSMSSCGSSSETFRTNGPDLVVTRSRLAGTSVLAESLQACEPDRRRCGEGLWATTPPAGMPVGFGTRAQLEHHPGVCSRVVSVEGERLKS